jgi:hypothetical protein
LTARIALTASIAVAFTALLGAWLAVQGSPDGDAHVAAAVGLDPRVSRTASLETGDFSEFSQSEAVRGSLTVVRRRAYDGSHAAAARYAGGPGNGFARATQNVSLGNRQNVWYGAAYYLPAGFKRAMQSQVALLRWDDYRSRGELGDVGGVVVWGSDRRARLVLASYRGRERVLVGPFRLPESRWFSLLVHQRLAARGGAALSEVYVDGRLAGSSRAANTTGRRIERVRYGIVAVDAAAQRKRLALLFDRCLVTVNQRSPLDAGSAERAWAANPNIDDRGRFDP